MYAIIPLPPSAALRFESLAPYEVRHVLRDLGRLPRVHAFGATLFGAPVGLALATEPSETWSAPGVVRIGGAGDARLLAITVARAHRRMGVGTELLAAIERTLAQRGIERLSCTYALRADTGLDALEALFRKAGWDPPKMTMLQCRADNALLNAPIVRELAPLPDEYRITDWIDVTSEEREALAERQRREPWYPEDLDPFHFESELEPMNSLALRYHGDVVGWLLTHSTTPTVIQYRCLFVRADLARLGRGLSMLRESILRHWRAIAPAQGAGEWSTPASLPLMIRFIRRHLEPFGAVVTEQRVTAKRLGEGGRVPPVLISAAAPVMRTLLSEPETTAARTRVLSARKHWTPRLDTLPCFTMGANSMFDTWDGDDAYNERVARGNALAYSHLRELFERLRIALGDALGGNAAYDADVALPSIRIQEDVRGSHLPLFAIRNDITHTQVYPGVMFAAPPMSFALNLSRDACALSFWHVSHADAVGLDSEETARLLDHAGRDDMVVPPGSFVLCASDRFCQFAPLRDGSPRSERIVVTGQAVLFDGVWRLFS